MLEEPKVAVPAGTKEIGKVEKVPFRKEIIKKPFEPTKGAEKLYTGIIDSVVGAIHGDARKCRERWREEETEWAEADYIQRLPPYYRNVLKMTAHKPDSVLDWIGWGIWTGLNTIISITMMPIGLLFFLLEESCQTMGMGLWISYQSKKYDAVEKLLGTYIKFVDTSTIIVDKAGFLCPWMALGVKIYLMAADEQIKTFTEVLAETKSTDVRTDPAYFTGMPAKVGISSTPTHTKIYIDDRYTRRITPETFYNIKPGQEYHIKVEYEDTELGQIISNTKTVSALEGEELHITFNLKTQIEALKLKKILAPPSLTINSTPDGASIILDGMDTGMVTDATIEDIKPGKHTIRLEYKDPTTKKTAVVESTIKLEAWERRTERFDLSWAIRGL